MQAVIMKLSVAGILFSSVASIVASQFPLHAWDSHIHVIDPDRFSLDPDREYTPKAATVHIATEFEAGSGIEHATIVLPSVYGTNNSVLLDALRFFQGQYRGVAVVDPGTISSEELQELHDAGVRGLRVNTGSGGTNDEIVSAVRKNAAVAKVHGWAVEVFIPLSAFVVLHDVILDLDVPVVADHYAYQSVGSMTNTTANTVDPYATPGFHQVIDIVQRRRLFVKLSAPYRTSKSAPLYEDMRVTAQALINAGPDMVVYGSDWPHTGSKEGNAQSGGRLIPQQYRDINDPVLVEIFKQWCGSDAQIQRTFVDNPRRLWQWYEES